MRFETKHDIDRETKAMEKLAFHYGWKWEKLGLHDLDFFINNIGYLEAKGRNRNIEEAFPLPLAERKYKKLIEKPPNSIIVWSCFDGLIYADIRKITFTKRIGGRMPRLGSSNDIEMMYYIDRQPALNYITGKI